MEIKKRNHANHVETKKVARNIFTLCLPLPAAAIFTSRSEFLLYRKKNMLLLTNALIWVNMGLL
ncbi:hypothetical protein HanIR_Chr01g0016641 [Helianthus annuus]|nr:hypothetical protein HanIR_Chr01g0016641 [Helianthus annuus]